MTLPSRAYIELLYVAQGHMAEGHGLFHSLNSRVAFQLIRPFQYWSIYFLYLNVFELVIHNFCTGFVVLLRF